jgi:GH25 family lysozyme M1 (1,4-beta-N-acetylmuramidase)
MFKVRRRTTSAPQRPAGAKQMVEPLEERLLMRALGVDVSSYQGSPNWSSVYSSGRTFAWAKATEGLTFNDTSFSYNAANASSGNVILGAYHFARYDLGHAAADEAAHFESVAASVLKPGYLAPALDVEHTTTMSNTSLSTWVNTFNQKVLTDTGAKPLVYTYASFAASHFNSSVTQWDLWMADYNGQAPGTGAPSTSPWSTWAFWQYGSGGTVSGISGNVDVDVANGTITGTVIPKYVTASSHFAVGQTVHVTNAPSGLKAWDTYASNNTYVVKANGTAGVIQSNHPVFIDGYERWQVKYSGDTVSRWSAQDWLA